MEHTNYSDRKPAHVIAGIGSEHVTQFVSECMRTKQLSMIVKDLNHDLLFGIPKEREEARTALEKLGFL